MINKGFHIIASFCILAMLQTAAISGTLRLDDSLTKTALGRHMEFLVDPGGDLRIGNVSSPDYGNRWKASPSDGPGFGFTGDVYWVRFTLNNGTHRDLDLLLEQDYPLIDSIMLFAPENRGFKVTEAGDYRPFSGRPFEYRTFIFPLRLEKRSAATYYLRFQTTSSMNIPLTLWSPEHFAGMAQQENRLLVLFNGVMAVLIVYVLFLFAIIRWYEHLYFSLMLASSLLFMSTQNGTAMQFIWPDSPWLANFSVPVILCLLFIFFLLFHVELLELRTLRRRTRLRAMMWKSATGFLWLNSLVLLSCLILPYRYGMVISSLMAGSNIIYAFILYILLMAKEGNRQAKLALFLFLPVIASTMIYLLKTFSFLPTNFLTEWSVHFGLLTIAMFFSTILADKVKNINNELTQTHMNLIVRNAQVTENEELIFRLQYYDSTTGLPNKNLLEFLLQKEIILGRSTALMCLGIDKFKGINDLYGAAAGDDLLKMIAMRLKERFFMKDVVVRTDTDMFMILLTDIGGSEHDSILVNLEKIARKAQSMSTDHFGIDGNFIKISTSIGLCVYPTDGTDAESLMKNCETAMHMARGNGSMSFHYYDAALNEKMTTRLRLERSLSDAIRNGELLLHYQPKVDNERRIMGLEALVRWNAPDIGMIPPSEFIPLAENNGMIVQIGGMVFEMACRQIVAWKLRGRIPPRISVNLSPYQFARHDLLDDLKGILDKTGADPHYLEVEITESGIMQDEQDAIIKLKEIRKLGIAISVDDFGTGYSSLSKLKHYPIDTLKIDKSFVESLPDDRASAIISTAIITLGHNLGFDVVAEGVETEHQREFLMTNLCDYYQGFYFYKPMPPGEVERLLPIAEPEPSGADMPAMLLAPTALE